MREVLSENEMPKISEVTFFRSSVLPGDGKILGMAMEGG